MALQATPYRFKVKLSDVDRGVYEALDVRMARHPSENERFLLARLFAHCCFYEEGLQFSKGGLSSPDEPPLSLHTFDGTLSLWIEIGNPSVERLHKASKAAQRVIVVTHHDPALLLKELHGEKVHKLDKIEIRALAPSFLDAIAARIGDRGAEMELTILEGQLYVQIDGTSITGELERIALASTRG